MVSFLKKETTQKRDHSKWCQSCTVWGQFAGIGVHLLRAIGLLQRGEIHDVVVYLRESKGGKRIHGVRCCISKWSLFRKDTTPKTPIVKNACCFKERIAFNLSSADIRGTPWNVAHQCSLGGEDPPSQKSPGGGGHKLRESD